MGDMSLHFNGISQIDLSLRFGDCRPPVGKPNRVSLHALLAGIFVYRGDLSCMHQFLYERTEHVTENVLLASGFDKEDMVWIYDDAAIGLYCLEGFS